MADLFANDPLYKYKTRGLFAIAKIAIEYLFYVGYKKNIYVNDDLYFMKICSALHQYTKTQRIKNYLQVNKKATNIWPIHNFGVNARYITYFSINNILRKMSINDYIEIVCKGKRDKLLYWLQIINIDDLVGVLIALGGIYPVICIVGTPILTYRFGIYKPGMALNENAKFKI